MRTVLLSLLLALLVVTKISAFSAVDIASQTRQRPGMSLKKEAIIAPPVSSQQCHRSVTPPTQKCVAAASSRLFSESSGTSDTGSTSSSGDAPSQKRQNVRMLARLSGSGMLAYAYMKYWTFVAVGSSLYYLFQKTVRTV